MSRNFGRKGLEEGILLFPNNFTGCFDETKAKPPKPVWRKTFGDVGRAAVARGVFFARSQTGGLGSIALAFKKLGSH